MAIPQTGRVLPLVENSEIRALRLQAEAAARRSPALG
jgi:hypothetical protein